MAGYGEWRQRLIGAVDPRFYPAEWIDEQVESGVLAFVEGEAAAALVMVETYPSGWREVRSFAAAGDLDEIAGRLIPSINEAARQLGAKSSRIVSRRAWARLLPDYHEYQVSLEKEL